MSPLAHRLLSVEEVEADIALLEEVHPSLVHGTLAGFGLAAITQLFRELLGSRSRSVILDDLARDALL